MTRSIPALATACALAALAAAAQADDATGQADLVPLNAEAAASTATLTVSGNTLTIRINAIGTPPGVMHLQHFHGFAEGDGTSACPAAESVTNGDRIIDLIETERGAGITMVPFHARPASMEIVAETYPTADTDGAYNYDQTVSLSALEAAFAERFPGQQLDFDRRVIFLHFVSDGTELFETVQSFGDDPAHVTFPNACGATGAADG